MRSFAHPRTGMTIMEIAVSTIPEPALLGFRAESKQPTPGVHDDVDRETHQERPSDPAGSAFYEFGPLLIELTN